MVGYPGIDDENVITKRYGNLVLVATMGKCPHDIFAAREIYKQRGKFQLDLGEPVPRPSRENCNRYLMIANLYEPDPCSLVVNKRFRGKSDTSVAVYGFEGGVIDLAMDFLSVIEMEPLEPDEEFRRDVEATFAGQKVVFDAFRYAQTPEEEAKRIFLKAIRITKQLNNP